MTYDEATGALKLKNIHSRKYKIAPWLHLQQHRDEVHTEEPWMYCHDCKDYMVPVKLPDNRIGPKSTFRVPMRNRQEALYTCWHMDLGFPQLRESLLKIFPALQGQLPTTDEVWEFQKMKQDWITRFFF